MRRSFYFIPKDLTLWLWKRPIDVCWAAGRINILWNMQPRYGGVLCSDAEEQTPRKRVFFSSTVACSDRCCQLVCPGLFIYFEYFVESFKYFPDAICSTRCVGRFFFWNILCILARIKDESSSWWDWEKAQVKEGRHRTRRHRACQLARHQRIPIRTIFNRLELNNKKSH